MKRWADLQPLLFALICLTLLFAGTTLAQATAFTYQGKLTDGGNPATGSYDMQFKLFDTATVGTGTQQGPTLTITNVPVTAAGFSVQLDFGDCATCFDGSPRFLEIAVRQAGGGSFTTMAPRQPLTATPYAIRSQYAAAADGLSLACVNCITGSQIQSIDGSQVTGSIAGSQISGTVPVDSVPTGSGNYIQNAATLLRLGKDALQQAASFSIDGNGLIAGSLGVGTTAPGNRLTVDLGLNTPVDSGITVQGKSSAFGDIGLRVKNLGAGGGEWYIDSTSQGSGYGAGKLAFVNAPGSAVPVMTLTQGFNVGIGTAFPTQRLTVQTPTANYGLLHTDGNVQVGTFVGAGATGTPGGWFGTKTNHPLRFFTNDGTASLTVDTSGNVGVGTTNPTSKLTVEGTADPLLRINHNGTTGFPSLWLQQDGVAKAFVYWDKDSAAFNIGTPSINPALTIFDSGTTILGGSGNLNVGGLTIRGITGTTQNTTQVCVTTGSKVVVICSSSLRYKTDVETFLGGLDIIKRLRPISFNWKSGGPRDIGFGAEEVEQVSPLLTFRNDRGEVEGVRYNQLSAVFVNAIKQQQGQIEQQRAESEGLRRQVSEQQQLIEQQQRRVEALRRLVCKSNPDEEICKP